jgi:hypothetical protein
MLKLSAWAVNKTHITPQKVSCQEHALHQNDDRSVKLAVQINALGKADFCTDKMTDRSGYLFITPKFEQASHNLVVSKGRQCR